MTPPVNETKAHPAFEFIRRQLIESLNIAVAEYRHKKTGAQHIHIAADKPENVFLVALRTVPQDSTGVAHILEHTVLCGSEKYPVRDPFFMMIRRSLNTFMNAFTSSDWTAYPFASQNRKDFYNLLDVYLDAVFFPRLDELDFSQEGHRIEFAEPDNGDSPLVYKGVVYNEMKGAMSSAPATLWHTLCKYLYPTTTYHYNSGGDPECIPDLSFRQLVDFYRSHYHPSNAIFMTFGDIPAAKLQAVFDDKALSRFDRLDKHITVGDEKRYLSPVRVEEYYPFDEPGEPVNKTHIVLGWLLGKATDLESALKSQLLCGVLLDNSASPLQKFLETSGLGTAPSPLCGLDDSQRELCFVCGIEGSEPERAEALETRVLEVLKEVSERGVDRDQVEACLHQLELQQREIGGDTYPYGLQLIMTALTSATHRGDPIALLDLDPALDKLRREIADPEFIKNLTRELLLDNPHRVRLTLRPEPELSRRRERAEAKKLEKVRNRLGESDRRQLLERAAELSRRQQQRDDASLLPKVGLEDIPLQMAYVAPADKTAFPLPVTSYATGTNGLVYQQEVLVLPHLSARQTDLLPLYCILLTELGIGDRDYLAVQQWQSRVCGSIHASASARCMPDNLQDLTGHLVLSAKGLARNQAAMSELMQATLQDVRFDELPRTRELVAQTRARRESGITSNGHGLAMTAASSGASPGAALGHRWGGLAGIRFIKRLDTALSDHAALESLAAELCEMHRLIQQCPRQYLLIGEAEPLSGYRAAMLEHFPTDRSEVEFETFHQPYAAEKISQLWQVSTQVNFCARAYPTVPMDHVDAAPLTVLGGFLRNGYLHRAIREQGGAYGGGAGQDNHSGAFRFFSYRDPRLEATLEDFDKSLIWLEGERHEWSQVEEAILGVIGTIDKPGSPAGEAKQTFYAELYGRTRDKRELFRNRVLQVTLEDLQRVAQSYLTADKASTAIITNPERRLDGLEIHSL